MTQTTLETNSNIDSEFQIPDSFLGRMVIEAVNDDVKTHMLKKAGIDPATSLIELPEAFITQHKVPLQKGKIIKMDASCFGEAFERKYGKELKNANQLPKLGDVVMFIPHQSYKLDNKNKYHIIGDEDVVAIIRQ